MVCCVKFWLIYFTNRSDRSCDISYESEFIQSMTLYLLTRVDSSAQKSSIVLQSKNEVSNCGAKCCVDSQVFHSNRCDITI